MGAFADLARAYERFGATAHARGMVGAAERMRDEIEGALAPHRRTGTAAGSLVFTIVGNTTIVVEEVRYQPFIKGIPRGPELQRIAVDGYRSGLRAAIAEVRA